MIPDVLMRVIGWFFTILWWPLSFIPDGSEVIERGGDSLAYFITLSHGFDFILPVSEALLLFRIGIVVSFAISVYYGVIFVMRLIRGY